MLKTLSYICDEVSLRKYNCQKLPTIFAKKFHHGYETGSSKSLRDILPLSIYLGHHLELRILAKTSTRMLKSIQKRI